MRRVLVLFVAVLMVAAACGDTGKQVGAGGPSTKTSAQNYSVRGPFAVGATRLAIDPQRPVEVFYPANRGSVPANADPYRYTPDETLGPLLSMLPAGIVQPVITPDAWFNIPASTGPFPVVVFDHGYALMRFSYTFHAAHLASWGYVVALPEIPGRDLHARFTGTLTTASDLPTILDTVALLKAESRRPGSLLEGRVTGEQVAVEGHSAGGRDAALAAYDPTVDTWIGDAPVAPIRDAAAGGRDPNKVDVPTYLASAAPPKKPSMVILTQHDVAIDPSGAHAVYNWLPAPKRLIELAGTGHGVFVNDCEAIQQHGGSAIAEALGLPRTSQDRQFLEDGCLPGDPPVKDMWAVWDHLTVAQLNVVFDINREQSAASLERSYLDTTFPGRISEYEVQPAS